MDLRDTIETVRWVRELPDDLRQKRNLALLERAPLIDLELASACNVVCRFCPRADMQRTDALMSEETFAAVLELLPADAVIMLSGLGEAVLHPQLPDYVARLSARGWSPCMITNGVRLTPERQHVLIEAGIAQFQISVHGLDGPTVHTIMPRGARPQLVRSHLEHLARTRPASLRVRINFVETADNEHARPEVEQLARQLGFEFFYRREHTRGRVKDIGRPVEADEGCGIFAAVTFISADGDVLPCVNDVRGEARLGNVRGLSWAQVLAWKRHVIGDSRWFEPCSSCDDDYRWALIAQGQVDGELPPANRPTSMGPEPAR
jgi:MoaA/NifB/PqqE/SkfB family radical SAM enzyme